MAACSSPPRQSIYSMKPINEFSLGKDDLPNPACMYNMKSFHENATDKKLECLYERQWTILKDLEKVKGEICEISPDVAESSGISCEPKVSNSLPVSMKEPLTIVVKASPSNPPLALIVLLKIFQSNGLTCSIVAHKHSSLTSAIPDFLCDVFKGAAVCDANTHLCLRVIWKKQILAPSLMVSVVDQSPILGEANILRYLSRLLMPHLYCKFGPLQMANIDAWLNAAIVLTSSNNGKAFVESLNAHLGKNRWLVGNSPSLADVYCSIAVLQTQNGNNYPSNIEKWTNNCRKELSGFQDVEKMLQRVS